MPNTFPGGVHPAEKKELTADRALQRAAAPSRVTIPVIQHTGAPCVPLVKAGQAVKKGQLIGAAEQFITSPVHASISGTVKEIKEAPHPTAGKSLCVVIESDGKDEWDASVRPRSNAMSLSREEIIDIVRQSGIVGLGGAAFPTHVKLKPPKKIDTVILNGAECEPYLTCDDRLMIERPKDVIKGLLLIMKAVDVSRAAIAIESNKPKAAVSMRKALADFDSSALAGKDITFEILPTKYPQGSEKQLIEAVLKRRVPPRGLPLDVGCVVQNAGTAAAISDAVYEGKPLIERGVTLSGDCVKEPVNVNVRIGTGVRELLEAWGGEAGEVSKVVVGGPMMGIAQPTMDIPVIKGTSGILFLSEKAARVFKEIACIKCGRCVNVCPMNLLPLAYARLVKKERWQALENYYVDDCMECGSCAYACPSRIPLVHYIKTGKRALFYIRKKS